MKLSDAEWKVMKFVWAERRCAARDVHRALADDTEWAYTTVKTVLARLVAKGALDASMEGNTSIYAPRITREEARRSEVRSLLDRAFEGSLSPLMHFLLAEEKLSDTERAELERLLREGGKEGAP